jgi:hypothetical protein
MESVKNIVLTTDLTVKELTEICAVCNIEYYGTKAQAIERIKKVF